MSRYDRNSPNFPRTPTGPLTPLTLYPHSASDMDSPTSDSPHAFLSSETPLFPSRPLRTPSPKPKPKRRNPLSPGCPSAGGYVPLHYPWLHHPKPPGSPDSIPSRPTAFNTEPVVPEHPAPIEPGTYVAFALATDAIAERFPEDSEARREVAAFPTGRYIGLVTTSFTYVDEEDGGREIEELVLHYVAREPPSPPATKQHWMGIAGADAKSTVGEGPLRTNVFFPVVNAVQWTTQGIRLQVEKMHPSALTFALKDSEFERFEDAAVEHYETIDTSDPNMDDDEADEVERWAVPLNAIPAEIWQDIRVGADGVPSKFLDEIDEMESLLLQYEDDEEDEPETETETESDEETETETETEIKE
ncbi:hypothetical protein PLICRDRAFT_28649 [Plicaturopsis crispa FD-325 SS-3]|nr:hypothetical protein PLICRDRAFT_28649 [Plicaturopsis crispa FD-325 SS-3]